MTIDSPELHEQDTRIDITELDESQIPEVSPLLLAAWQEFARNTDLSKDDRFANSDPDKWLRSYLEGGGHGFVARDGDQVAGVITCKIEQSPGYYRDAQHLFINDVAVSPDYRRKGIALELEKRCEGFAKEHGVNLILGEIYTYNDASREMMKKLGRHLGYEVWFKQLEDKN